MFYMFSDDVALITIVDNLVYLGIKLDSEVKCRKQDNLTGIVGGIGLSMIHETKRKKQSQPRNSILLRCNESKLANCLSKCQIILYIDKLNIKKDHENQPLVPQSHKKGLFIC